MTPADINSVTFLPTEDNLERAIAAATRASNDGDNVAPPGTTVASNKSQMNYCPSVDAVACSPGNSFSRRKRKNQNE